MRMDGICTTPKLGLTTFANQPADNNVMHAKSGLRVLLEWKIYRPDSVITAVILRNYRATTD